MKLTIVNHLRGLNAMTETGNYYGMARHEVASFIPQNIGTILDIGCGEGFFLKLVKEQTGAETWGIEMINEVADKAKMNADNILKGKVEDVLNLIPNDHFDCITFNDVLEHLLEPTEILKIIKPKLSSKGIIIASIPNVWICSNLYELLIKRDWEYKDFGILDSTHLRFFTKISMKRMFEKAGYKLIEQKGINKVISWKFKLFNLLTLGAFNDSKYTQFVCIAT